MKYKDPHREREIEKYGQPIPSREFLLNIIEQSDTPKNFRQLITLLELSNDYEITAVKHRLRAMERDGQLLYNRKGQYTPIKKEDLIAGRVIGHPDGFGFLVPDDGSNDLFLSAKQMRKVLHGDRLLVNIAGVDHKGRREGTIIETLEANTKQIVGRFFIKKGLGFVVPDNKRISQDILIAKEHYNNAKSDQIVVTTLIKQPTSRSKPMGKITEVLGSHMSPGMEIDIALRSHNLPYEWPETVKQAIDQLQPEIDSSDIKNRTDIRSLPLVTIDGADSRDFDDAVYCERDGKDWRLLVAIADVSHYVAIKSALDDEAINRGTSVYFPKQVIPMLPELLSNGLCSLNPNVDRYCMVADIRITRTGLLKSWSFFQGVMNSSARLTYDEMAQCVIEKSPKARKKRYGLNKHLDNLYKLYKVLRQQRDKRGSIDFDTQETQIIFGADRKIEDIVPLIRSDAHKLIEEFMILANICAAKFLKHHKIPSLHRVHPEPESNKVEDLRAFLNGLGLSLSGGDSPTPRDYANVLEQIKKRPDAHLIQMVLLRSLSQASYRPDGQGHFGLALDDYAHFTSPIRRYPDLLVHRGIRHIISKHKTKAFHYSPQDMAILGEQCSMTERRAEDASRDVTAWLKCEYMLNKVGETFDGIISSVTSFGLFIELNNIFVEGLVHVTHLTNDYYQFDAIKHRLRGERSGKIYQLGDTITVKIARVDIDDRKIDFMLPEMPNKTSSKKSQYNGKKKTSSNKYANKKKSNKNKTSRRASRKPKGQS